MNNVSYQEIPGFFHNMPVTLIEKNDPSCPTETIIEIDILKTKASMGLNFYFDDNF